MGKLVYGYWDIRGLAEPARYLLHFKNVDFVDKRYDLNDMESWKSEKFNLGFHFPNLPYLIDGDLRITQSIAILRYLARKYGLDGQTDSEKIRISMVEQELVDLRTSVGNLCYSDEFEKLKPEFAKKAPEKLQQITAFLGGRQYLAGDIVTYVDFMALDVIDFHRYLIPGLLEDNPQLKEYYDRIKGLPELQKYLKSSAYKAWPIFSPGARFGGSGLPPSYVK